MKKPPSPDRIRLTIAVTADTHEAFQHYAEAAGISIGRAMGDWLGEQINAVTYAALRFEEVRDELRDTPQAIARAVVPDGQREPLQAVRGAPLAGGRGRPEAASPPRPVIRGGNSPKGGTK